MKRIVIALSLAASAVTQAQTISSFFQLQLDGKPFRTAEGGEINFGSQADCVSAVRTLGGHADVKGGAVFGCPFFVRYTPAPVVKPPQEQPVVKPPATPPATTGRGLTPACESVVAADFQLRDTRTVDAVASLAKPARGAALREPAYGTCLVRATDAAADGKPGGFMRNDYARRQAFNADSTRFVAYALDGSWHLYDAATMAHIKEFKAPGPGADAEFQWSAIDPDVFYYTPVNGVGMRVHEQRASTGADRVVGDFGARLRARWPDASAAWTKSEGSPSKDGRYWCFMVDNVVGSTFKGRGIFTWDRQTDTILGMADNPGGVRPDSVSMSPSGSHCVWNGDTGIMAYTRDLKSSHLVTKRGEHSDLGIDANGRDVFVSVDYGSGNVFMVDVATGARTDLLQSYVDGTASAFHFSGKNFNKPGWFLLETYADYDTRTPAVGRRWFHRKLMAVELKANPKVLSLAHTRVLDNGYWTEPHATVNRDFTRVLFNSNWGMESDAGTGDGVDAYMLQIPAGAVK